jgi:hypothetical protein
VEGFWLTGQRYRDVILKNSASSSFAARDVWLRVRHGYRHSRARKEVNCIGGSCWKRQSEWKGEIVHSRGFFIETTTR